MGLNPVITGFATAPGTLDYIFCTEGSDYVTFDGINVQETTGAVEFGYAILRSSPVNGSQNITIKNCAITLNKTSVNTKGIYSNNHNASVNTSIAAPSVTGNSRIQSVTGGGQTQFIAAAGNGGLLNMYNNLVSNNIVASTGGTYGINASFDIGTRNVYNNTVTNISKAEGAFYGIYGYNVSANTGLSNFYRNTVSNIEGLTAGSNIYGFYLSSSAANFGSTALYVYSGSGGTADVRNNIPVRCAPQKQCCYPVRTWRVNC